MSTNILADIETNAIAALKAAGLGVQEVNLDDDPPGIAQTAVHCMVSDVKFKPLTMTKWKAITTLSVLVFIKNVQNEKARRQGAYPVIFGCLGKLCNNALGLNIVQLAPVSLTNITPANWKGTGIIVYQLDFVTSFSVSAAELADNAVDLLKIGIEYFLQPDDDVADAEDTLILQTLPEEPEGE